MSEESTLVELAARLAADADEFDQLATALEHGSAEEWAGRLAAPSILAAIEPHLDDVPPLGGLEMGVAGLVYALSAVGCWTAASCRGHPGELAWTHGPLIFLAADRHRTEVLQRLVDEVGCGFGQDYGMELLAVEAESIEDLMTLAPLVLKSRPAFIPPRAPRLGRPKDDGTQGPNLTLGI